MDSDREQAKIKINRLVEQFSKLSSEELHKKSEEQIKFLFIEPLLEALGWEKQDIEKEFRILKGRADYVIKLGNENVLVVEAKKAGVHLNEDEGRQAVSYAYHKNIKFAVVTNFAEVQVYHALSNIKNIHKNLAKDDNGYLILGYTDFEKSFDRLWVLSKESFEEGRIQKLLSSKDVKLSKPIDKSILQDLLVFREWLSKDLKSLRTHLDDAQIDEIIQILIDRLIFIRCVEDRGLEDKDSLQKLIDDFQGGRTTERLWESLKKKFEYYDKTYDSKLFSHGLLESEGFFNETVLIKTIKGLYYGTEHLQERYMFDEIPSDLLGSIYEQYLGTILKSTEKRVKLAEGTGKRKEMGIFYTPSYIVDNIVKNTIGNYAKDKSIDEILRMAILDPACGSGSFLVRAFKEICDTIEQRLRNGEKSSDWMSFKEYSGRLTISQKIAILTNCIYGVDLDEKAVELANLNLLIKLLEDETKETKKFLLPNLKNNIKCGNSLIDDSNISERAFVWKAQFSGVFNKGGFDVVLGNPPYIRIQTIQDTDQKQVTYLKQHYTSASSGNYDIYVVFVEKGLSLLNEKGRLGFILPHKFFNAQYGEPLRQVISEGNHLSKVVHFGDQQVFEGASTYTCLMFLNKEKSKSCHFTKVNDLELWRKKGSVEEGLIDQSKITKSEWNFTSERDSALFEKLNRMPTKLGDIADIFVGLQTSADPIYIIEILKDQGKYYEILCRKTKKQFKIERDVVKPILMGKDIDRWYISWRKLGLIFPYKTEKGDATLIEENKFQELYPLTWKYFVDNKHFLDLREKGGWKNKTNWHAFVYEKNLGLFSQEKILTQVLSSKNSFTFDANGEYYFVGGGNAGGYGIALKEEYKKYYRPVLALLNSTLLEFYLKKISTPFRGGFYSYGKRFIERLPIITIDFRNMAEKKTHDRIVGLVDKMLDLQITYRSNTVTGNQKESLEQQMRQLEWQIDEEVYKLYSITDEEKKIIEESVSLPKKKSSAA